MSTAKSEILNDKTFFRLILVVSILIPLVVTALYMLPENLRPSASFAKHLPFINAIINTLVTIALLSGYYLIRVSKNKFAHKLLMLTAFVLSGLFLVSYVTFHLTIPSTHYGGEGLVKYIYLLILLTHILLAAAIVPMVLYTIYYSTSGNFIKHKKIARVTLPLWLYVSITGVIVYLMISPYYNF